MDIMELGAVGELVGGVAVIATLIYLGLQVRHSAATGRVTASAAMSDGFNRAISQFDLNLAKRAMMPGVDGLTPEERFLWASQLYIVFCHLETMFFQGEEGLLQPHGIARERTVMVWFATAPGVQAWWNGNIYDDRDFLAKELFSHEFREHVDGIARSGVAALRETP